MQPTSASRIQWRRYTKPAPGLETRIPWLWNCTRCRISILSIPLHLSLPDVASQLSTQDSSFCQPSTFQKLENCRSDRSLLLQVSGIFFALRGQVVISAAGVACFVPWTTRLSAARMEAFKYPLRPEDHPGNHVRNYTRHRPLRYQGRFHG